LIAALALLLVAWLDRSFGEPRNALHPVAWLGRLIAVIGRKLPATPPAPALAAGLFAWALVVGGVSWLAWVLQRGLAELPVWAALPLLALLLKPALCWSMLRDEVAAVEAALAEGLDAGRARVAMLCSRDVSQLYAAGVRETAIETLAENLNDSWVAPLFWFAVAGLPGAWAWRTINTLDACWGYRSPRWEWAGKVAARADDLGAWLPARLTALLLGLRPGLRREAARTPSPNGGWPMAAMALRLGVRLRKPGVYTLNAAGRAPEAADTAAALRIAGQAAGWGLLLAVLGSWCLR
jgi:adenosylcobinamide-phosphate synthase